MARAPFRSPLRAAVAAVTLAFAAVAAPPRAAADELDKQAAEVGELIADGRFEFVADLLDAVAPAVQTRPKTVRAICEGLDEAAGQVTKANLEKARACCTTLSGLTKECLVAAKDDADALWSMGAVRRFRGRIERDHGTSDPADWNDAADLFMKSWKASADGGRAAADAASTWFEAARIPGAAAAELAAKADALLDEAMKAHPDGPPVIRAWGMRQVERALAVPPAKKNDAKAILEAALARVGPLANRAEPDIDAATVWNEIAVINVRSKLGMKAPFVAKVMKAGASLEAKVPVSRYFSVDDEDGYIHQFDSDFRAIRTIGFDDYAWDTAFSFGVKGYDSIGGDNGKGIAMGTFFQKKAEWAEPKSAKEPAKKALNARITGSMMWEIAGVRETGGKPERARGWVFKSDKGWQTTLAVYLFEWVPADIDPAMDFVLDSLTERSRK
ncbi:MAG: hypothetical protein HMLKMBBP_01371 [Planctomycetes bacterium]|nr:hypothetical protein [Planctomycetota bacterium]